MRIIKWLRASIVRQCFVVLAVIGLLAVLAAAPALILTERSTGSGGASSTSRAACACRATSLRLPLRILFSSFEQRREKTMTALDEFGVKLMSPGLLNGVPHDSGNPAYIQYVALKDRFEKGVRPLAEASIDSLEARRRFTEQIPSFVEDVDRFVQTLENGLNERLALLQKILTLILFGAMGVSFVMLLVIGRRASSRPIAGHRLGCRCGEEGATSR